MERVADVLLEQPTEAQAVDRLAEERVYASQWKLMWWKFKSHHLAVGSLIVLGVLYGVVIFSQFLMPYGPQERHTNAINAPPQRIHFVDEEGFHLRPFTYALKQTIDMKSLNRLYEEDRTKKYPIYFFVKSEPYKFLSLFEMNRRLFGVEKGGSIYLLGTDRFGRDYLTRLVQAGQISLSIGLVGVFLSFLLGLVLGGVSGYYGGVIDTVIQRVIELLRSLPTIPLWMGLSAAVPTNWPIPRIYLMITIILSLIGWTDLARVVRGKVLAVREEDFVMAARLGGASEARIIFRHLLPSIFSYTIVSLTLSIPGMILGETALSFLGLGLQAPALSWGVLLQDAQNVRTVALYPWLLSPAILVVVTVLCFNFVGDGMRDAADPYVR